jgi:hypothetical protein
VNAEQKPKTMEKNIITGLIKEKIKGQLEKELQLEANGKIYTLANMPDNVSVRRVDINDNNVYLEYTSDRYIKARGEGYLDAYIKVTDGNIKTEQFNLSFENALIDPFEKNIVEKPTVEYSKKY